jgi:hypothetical protein
MDREDSGMGEDMTVELEVVEREPEGMVLTRHWTGEASTSSLGVGELAKLWCSEGQPMFTSRDSNCCSPCRRV